MTLDPTLDDSYATFLTEAQDLLKRIEQDLLSLRENRSPDKIHQLMRSAHTLKGAAASVELNSIKQVAHVLEDIFKGLYNPEVVIDAEVESILFEGYECLRLSVIAESTAGQFDQQEVLNRAAATIAKLQDKLGDCFDLEAPLPTSVELGFDVVQSMFEVVVGQRLQELEQTIAHGNLEQIKTELETKADLLLGLAESLELPGFAAIAQATLTALNTHPEQAEAIAKLALEDFRQGRFLVLAGDRSQGGTPSLELQALATPTESLVATESPNLPENPEHFTSLSISTGIEDEVSLTGAIEIDTEAVETDANLLSLDDLFGEITTGWEAPQPTDPLPKTPPAVERPLSSPAVHAVAPPPEPEPTRAEPVRVEVEQLKRLDYLAGEMLINQSKQTNQDQQLRSMVEELQSQLRQHRQTMYKLQDSLERLLGQVEQGAGWQPISKTPAEAMNEWRSGWAIPITAPTTNAATQFDVLEMDRYSNLHLLMRSALNETIQLDESIENIDHFTKQSRSTLEAQRRVLRQVRDDLTTLRMHPLGSLLNRFPRLLQQLTMAHHKPVELTLSGEHVLVDKAIAEKLYDPLLHLVRNAFAHGIEPAEVRRAQGKPEVGQIQIRASQQGNQTIIEVKDDGRGIDLQRVGQRAIELNLLTPEQASTIPESQLLDLLFQPGFSTATQLSDLSGRGIGLDVVNNRLQSMNGAIAVSTIPQQGTTFTLKIPLSITTTKLLVCQAQAFHYALPVEQVEQIVVPRADQIKTLGGTQLVMQWQHQQQELMVPLYELAEMVQYADNSAQFYLSANSSSIVSSTLTASNFAESKTVLLLNTLYGYRGLVVDRALGEYELVIRSVDAAITPPPYVYGCCILGNSRPALVIDVEVLMQLTTEVESLPEHALDSGLAATLSRLALSLPAASPLLGQHSPNQGNFPRPVRPKLVLVVDDSLTLRHNLTLLLKQAGYQVWQAEDGLEAIAQLQQHPNIDLILCDLEMPRLNGFEFLNRIRQEPSLSKIPVLVLTSRTSAKHRQVALALGAVAYFTKPYNRDELLAAIEGL